LQGIFLRDPEQYPFSFRLMFPSQLKSISTLSSESSPAARTDGSRDDSQGGVGQQGQELALEPQENLGSRKSGAPWPRRLRSCSRRDGHWPGCLVEVGVARVVGKCISKLSLQSS